MMDLMGVWRIHEAAESQVIALEDITLSLQRGDFVAVMGPSGSGKSTLLQIMGLLDRPTRGVVTLSGRDTSQMSDDERARLRLTTIGFVFQRFHLLAGLGAVEQVALPMEVAGVPPAERYDRAARLLRSVGLGDRLGFQPAQLSGGQRQRVAVARALANSPQIILADEPTGELHSEDKATVIQLFHRMHQEGRTIVVVTHDPDVASAAERRVDLRDGRLREVAA